MIDTNNLLYPIFLNFTTINALTILTKFSILCAFNNELNLPFLKTKLGIQILSYVGLATWNSLLITWNLFFVSIRLSMIL